MNINISLMKKPIEYMVWYMLLVLSIYIFGPIRWNAEWDFIAIFAVVLILSYIFAMYIGYRVKLSQLSKNILLNKNYPSIREGLEKKYSKILTVFIIINMFLTVLNAFEYAGAISISGLFNNAVNGLMNPADVYYGKDTSSRAGNIIVWITLILEPFLSVTRVMSLIYFKRFKLYIKLIVIFSIIVEILRWLAVGTNKGLMDVVMRLIVVLWVLLLQKQTVERVKFSITKFTSSVIMIVVFLGIFSSSISARVSGRYSKWLFDDFPYNLVPESFQFLVEKVDSYLTQGYFFMTQCIRYCDFSWTFGIGNSRFAMDTFMKLTGIDLFFNTYPAQLSRFGVDPYVSWHSAFSWFASDFGFYGIIFWMFLIGYYFAEISFETIYRGDPISTTLFYFIILALVNSSCTNYVLAFSNMFVGFWGLVIIRYLNNKNFKVRISK